MARIGLIGVGQIGGTLAYRFLEMGFRDLWLYDVNQSMLKGKAKDLYQASVIGAFPSSSLCLAENLEVMRDCDILVITAGKPRQPGIDRKDLLAINGEIVTSIVKTLIPTKAIFIIVTNPVDSISQMCYDLIPDRRRVIGMAGLLDSGRFRALIAEALGVSPLCLQASVLGPHNDHMVPLISSIRLNGLPLPENALSKAQLDEIILKTRKGGAEIVQLLGSGSAFYGPAESVAMMVASIVGDQKRLFSCSVKMEGEYGLTDIYCGAPAILGQKGLERILEFPLSKEEQQLLSEGADLLKKDLA